MRTGESPSGVLRAAGRWSSRVGAILLMAGCAVSPFSLAPLGRAPALPTEYFVAADTEAAPTMPTSALPSPSPPSTVLATPTATLHPLTIASLRQREYPGSEVVFEAALDPGANYQRSLVTYMSEGLRIFALLTVPNGEMPDTGWPVIIFNHGFIPPDEYRTTERYIAYVDSLARSGFIVFRPDYRGHGDSDGIASGAYGSPDYLVDVLNAVAAMRRYPAADPARIGMWGHSMGGYLTLRAMVVDPGIQAGVIWAGVVGSYPDLLSRWRPTPTPGGPETATPAYRGRWRAELWETFGSPDENPEFWRSISADSFLTEISGPLQLHHGTADTSVPFVFSEELYQKALAAGATVEFYSYPGADHNLSAPFSLAMGRTIEFFQRYLGDA